VRITRQQIRYPGLVAPAAASDDTHNRIKLSIASLSSKDCARAMKTKARRLLKAVVSLWGEGSQVPSWNCVSVNVPCPYCDTLNPDEAPQCQKCLCTKATALNGVEARWRACLSIRFGGVTMEEIAYKHKYVRIIYSPCKAAVVVKIPRHELDSHAMKVAQAEFDRCVRYLNAHCEWVSCLEWGSLVVDKRKMSSKKPCPTRKKVASRS
jgi:hypothetical protein